MKTMTRVTRWGKRAFGATLIILVFTAFTVGDDLFQIGKGIELFGSIYKELTFNYVEKIDPANLMRAGIRGMLSELDPYTTFIEDEDKTDVDMLTTGSYSGLGVTVVRRNGKYVITNILDESVRRDSDLRIGDVLLQIDSLKLSGDEFDMKKLLRGRAGTTVVLAIQRPAVDGPIIIVAERRNIPIKSITVVEKIGDDVGYIKLNRFTRSTGEDLRIVLHQLLADASIKALVLDLRDNPGGLLDAAVDVMEKFVPKGSLIVSTKGRQSNYSREYHAEEEPLCPSLPVAVLVNSNSASASEIVAGAFQDLDRGVVIGATTFGKGLVQSVIPLSYSASLKLTTSKYYTPSGRCIQKPIANRSGSNQIVIVDSSGPRTFYTLKNQRRVHEAGGIEPDIEVTADSMTGFLQTLARNGVFFDYSSETLNRTSFKSVPDPDPSMKEDLRRYVNAGALDSSDADRAVERLMQFAAANQVQKKFISRLQSLEAAVKEHVQSEFDKRWEEIAKELRQEFAFQMLGESARFKLRIPHDRQLQRAVSVVKSAAEYSVALQTDH